MNTNNDNNLISELLEAGYSREDAAEFASDLAAVDSLLDKNPVSLPDGLADRTMLAVEQALEAKRSRPLGFNRHLRAITAAAAMALVTVSIMFFYMNNANRSSNVIGEGDGSETVAKMEISSNPFAHPACIMDLLMDRNSVNGIDDLSLEAVSELWDESETDNVKPTSNKSGGGNQIFV